MDGTRTRPAPRGVRVARAAGVAAAAVLLAAVSHAAAGGHAPSPGVLAAAWALSLPVAFLLVGAGRGIVGAAAAAVLAQLALHGVFAFTGHGAGTAASDATGHAAHTHPVATLGAAPGGSWLSLLVPSPTMLAAHLVAAAAAILLVVVAGTLGRAVLRWRRRRARAPRPLPPTRVPRIRSPRPTPAIGRLAPRTIATRGPPRRCAPTHRHDIALQRTPHDFDRPLRFGAP